MRPSIDVKKGEDYWFSDAGESYVATFIKFGPDGRLLFQRKDGGSRCRFRRSDFLDLRGNGNAVRLGANQNRPELPRIEPDAFLPVTDEDSKNVRQFKNKYLKAVTQKYYVTCIDEYGIKKSIKKIKKFINEHKEIHEALRLAEVPGASTLIELCRECGYPGFRPIQLFLNGAGGDQKSGLWDQFILDRKAKMIEMYYTFSKPPMTEAFAVGWFKGEVGKERKRRKALGGSSLDAPVRSTLNRWLIFGGTEENKLRRLGRKTTNRQQGGIVPHLSANRPLECVVMDYTQIDLHLVLLNEFGAIKDETRRPWLMLVVDVYSRMILAANLTWEHPSLYSLMEGLRQTVKPKGFLKHLATSTSLSFACDGFGKFGRMLVDNDLSVVGQSMRMTSFSVGLDVSFAAVKNPETKSIGERTFGTLNTQLWHQSHGGVRARPGVLRDENPASEARFTIDEAQDMLWEYIVKVYHVAVHDGIGMAPARKWSEAYEFFNRPLIDDMREIDEAFNKTVVRQLTRGGIRLGNETYHDPEKTSALIRDLYRFNEKSLLGAKKNESVSIPVRVRELDDGDVSAVRVYNYARRIYVDIPNIDPEKRGTFAEAKVARIANNIANEEFYPSDQVDINRAEILSRAAPYPAAALADIANEGGSSSHRINIHNADKPMISRKGVQRGVTTRKLNAAKARKEEKQRKQEEREKQKKQEKQEKQEKQTRKGARTGDKAMFDANEVVANVHSMKPRERFASQEKEALLEAMKRKLKIKSGSQSGGTPS